MLGFLTVLLCCQLAGEVAARAAGLPVPGPVIGMGLLFAGLLVRGLKRPGGVPEELGRLSDGLLRHLSLLFVPAGVGVIANLDRLRGEALPVAVALVGGTVLTIGVTALVMAALLRRGGDEP